MFLKHSVQRAQSIRPRSRRTSPEVTKVRRILAPQSGFSSIELAAVVGIAMILSALATFGMDSFMRAYRAGADARAIASQLSLARMRASAAFTRARLKVDTNARTYQIELDTKAAPNGSFVLEGATNFLSPGVSFGFGTISIPAGEQTTIAQTDKITFNSRGIPVEDVTWTPTGNNAIYLRNDKLTYAVSVSETGRVSVWQNIDGSWVAQ